MVKEDSAAVRRSSRKRRQTTQLDIWGDDLALKQALKKSLLETKRTEAEYLSVPTFFPTLEDLNEPLSYFSTLAQAGLTSGVIKITTPPEWRPAFQSNSHDRFDTKRQLIHRLQEGLPFESGGMYNLEEYRTLANAFKAQWLADHPSVAHEITTKMATEGPAAAAAVIEREYWKIVENVTGEPTEVLYGSDINTDKYSSGFPPGVTAARKWDLRRLANSNACLLSRVGRDIEGLTVPWLYFGCMFATFCWHTEDHFLYSINYHHVGEPKSWYGVPSSAAYRLEELLRDCVPQRFAADRDLLHHLVVMMPPALARQHGVPVYHTIQEPGDIILTFPRAYHAGFSYGWNCAEATNYALFDWLPFGRTATDLYSKGTSARPAVFSHDKLLWDWVTAITAVRRVVILPALPPKTAVSSKDAKGQVTVEETVKLVVQRLVEEVASAAAIAYDQADGTGVSGTGIDAKKEEAAVPGAAGDVLAAKTADGNGVRCMEVEDKKEEVPISAADTTDGSRVTCMEVDIKKEEVPIPAANTTDGSGVTCMEVDIKKEEAATVVLPGIGNGVVVKEEQMDAVLGPRGIEAKQQDAGAQGLHGAACDVDVGAQGSQPESKPSAAMNGVVIKAERNAKHDVPAVAIGMEIDRAPGLSFGSGTDNSSAQDMVDAAGAVSGAGDTHVKHEPPADVQPGSAAASNKTAGQPTAPVQASARPSQEECSTCDLARRQASGSFASTSTAAAGGGCNQPCVQSNSVVNGKTGRCKLEDEVATGHLVARQVYSSSGQVQVGGNCNGHNSAVVGAKGELPGGVPAQAAVQQLQELRAALLCSPEEAKSSQEGHADGQGVLSLGAVKAEADGQDAEVAWWNAYCRKVLHLKQSAMPAVAVKLVEVDAKAIADHLRACHVSESSLHVFQQQIQETVAVELHKRQLLRERRIKMVPSVYRDAVQENGCSVCGAMPYFSFMSCACSPCRCWNHALLTNCPCNWARHALHVIHSDADLLVMGFKLWSLLPEDVRQQAIQSAPTKKLQPTNPAPVSVTPLGKRSQSVAANTDVTRPQLPLHEESATAVTSVAAQPAVTTACTQVAHVAVRLVLQPVDASSATAELPVRVLFEAGLPAPAADAVKLPNGSVPMTVDTATTQTAQPANGVVLQGPPCNGIQGAEATAIGPSQPAAAKGKPPRQRAPKARASSKVPSVRSAGSSRRGQSIPCIACGRGLKPTTGLQCMSCDHFYHPNCVPSALRKAKGDESPWLCEFCVDMQR